MSFDELLDAFHLRMAAYKGSRSSMEDFSTDSLFIEGGCLPSQLTPRSTPGPDDHGSSHHETNNSGVEVESRTMSFDEFLDVSAPRSTQGPDDLGSSHHASNDSGVQVFEIDPTLVEDASHLEAGSKYKGHDAFHLRMAAYKGSRSSMEDFSTDSLFIEGGCLPSQLTPRSTQGPDDHGSSHHETNDSGVEVESRTMLFDEFLDVSAPRSTQGPDDLGSSHHESNDSGVQVFEIDPTLMEDASHLEAGSKYKGHDSGMKVFDIDAPLVKGHGKKFACPHRGCMKRFDRAWNCKRHYIATHKTKKELRAEGSTYACGKCGRDYKNKSDLKKHFNRCSNNISRNK